MSTGLLERPSSQESFNSTAMLHAATTGYSRIAKLERYGRSLSTPYKVGAFAAHHAMAETIASPEAAQGRVELGTSVEEGFGTDKELGGGLKVEVFDKRPNIGGKVMAKDLKTAISKMTADGLECAEETVKTDWRFRPQLIRSKHDHANALTVDSMVRGETGYNTRIIVSPYPEEAAAEVGDAYWRGIGYVPHLKRGFVQVYHVMKDGTLLSGSLSFDGSNKHVIRRIFAAHGVEIPEGELTDDYLAHAITGNFTTEEAKALGLSIANDAADPRYNKTTNTVEVTGKYKPIIDMVYNESYIHACESLYRGYQTADTQQLIGQLAQKAHIFNDHYGNALLNMQANPDQFSDNDFIVIHELLVYSTIEMMRALHLQKNGNNEGFYMIDNYLLSLHGSSFQHALSSFGAEGARNNRTYSACGLAISAGEENTLGSPQETFGGADKDLSGKESTEEETECAYPHTGCYCCPYDQDGIELPEPQEVMAFRDKNGVASCLRAGCGAKLDKNGEVVTKGMIFEKALRRKSSKTKELAKV